MSALTAPILSARQHLRLPLLLALSLSLFQIHVPKALAQAELLNMHWLYEGEDKGISQLVDGTVIYLDPAMLKKTALTFKEGKLIIEGRPASTVSPHSNLPLKANMIKDQNGIWRLNTLEEPKIGFLYHHSSLAGGKPIYFAGDAKVVDGKIIEISNQSGHYTTPLRNFSAALDDLERQGALLPSSMIKVSWTKGAPFPFSKFIQNSDDLRYLAKYYLADDGLQESKELGPLLEKHFDEFKKIYQEHPDWLDRLAKPPLDGYHPIPEYQQFINRLSEDHSALIPFKTEGFSSNPFHCNLSATQLFKVITSQIK